MRELLERRLQALQSEFEVGQKMLADLEAKQAHLKSSLLRISGAIQVLEEMLGPDVQETLATSQAAASEWPTVNGRPPAV